MSVIIVPANRLSHSPANVRRITDPEADAQLDASIEANGVLQNLIAIPEKRRKGHYRVTGGGRRLSSVNRLIERGVFPAGHGVPVMILDLFDEVGGVELRSRYAGSKKHDLAASAEQLFAGDAIFEAEVKQRVLAWLPDAMRFVPPPEEAPVTQDAAIAPDDGIGEALAGKTQQPLDQAA